MEVSAAIAPSRPIEAPVATLISDDPARTIPDPNESRPSPATTASIKLELPWVIQPAPQCSTKPAAKPPKAV